MNWARLNAALNLVVIALLAYCAWQFTLERRARAPIERLIEQINRLEERMKQHISTHHETTRTRPQTELSGGHEGL